MSLLDHTANGTRSSGVDLRACEPTEFRQFHQRLADTFAHDVDDHDRAIDRAVFEPHHSLIGLAGDRIVCTSAWTTRHITVPGTVAPVAALTAVSVAPTHRRRGLLTAMTTAQLSRMHEEASVPLVAAWPSEAGIYGRYGYAPATRRAQIAASTPAMRLTPRVDADCYDIREAGLPEARPVIERVYEDVKHHRPGWLHRPRQWWDRHLHVPAHRRAGRTDLRVALADERPGGCRGYVIYSIRPNWPRGPEYEASIHEITAANPGAYAALWRFVLELDLVRLVTRRFAPVDDPLLHMLTDPRALQQTVQDGLWLRLVDVGQALANRRYASPLDTVLGVEDPLCPWNVGRWRLSGDHTGATCERTTSPPELVVTPADLAAAYLGETQLTSLAAAGRIEEARDGALHAVSRAFRSDGAFCPEDF